MLKVRSMCQRYELSAAVMILLSSSGLWCTLIIFCSLLLLVDLHCLTQIADVKANLRITFQDVRTLTDSSYYPLQAFMVKYLEGLREVPFLTGEVVSDLSSVFPFRCGYCCMYNMVVRNLLF